MYNTVESSVLSMRHIIDVENQYSVNNKRLSLHSYSLYVIYCSIKYYINNNLINYLKCSISDDFLFSKLIDLNF